MARAVCRWQTGAPKRPGREGRTTPERGNPETTPTWPRGADVTTNFEPQYFPYLRLAEAYLRLEAYEDVLKVRRSRRALEWSRPPNEPFSKTERELPWMRSGCLLHRSSCPRPALRWLRRSHSPSQQFQQQRPSVTPRFLPRRQRGRHRPPRRRARASPLGRDSPCWT